MEWLQQHQNALVSYSNPQSKFPACKSHASALLTSAQYGEEYSKS